MSRRQSKQPRSSHPPKPESVNRRDAISESKQTPSSPSRRTNRAARSFVAWWLLAFLLVLGGNPRWMSETARIIPPPSDAALAPDWTWSAPLSHASLAAGVVQPSFWIFAGVAATLITAVVLRVASSSTVWFAAAVCAALSLSIEPGDVLPAAAVLTAAIGVSRALATGRPWIMAATCAGCLFASVSLTIEFGLVLIYLAATVAPFVFDNLRSRRHIAPVLLSAAAMIAGIVVASMLRPGFAPAILRPVSWIWIRPDVRLLPSMGSALALDRVELLNVLLLLIPGCGWLLTFRRQDGAGPSVGLLFAFSVIGFGCVRYLWIACFAIAAGFKASVRAHSIASPVVLSRLNRAAVAACLLFALVRLALHYPYYDDQLVGGRTPPRLVDASAWRTGGSVMLMNLDHAPDWQTVEGRDSYRLLVDDRWDVFGDFYDDYAQVLRDLSEVRGEAYLRSDGRTGGYLEWTRQWKPTLLVADSGDVEAIRNLSLSPRWKLMGLDSRRTIFGWSDDRRNAAQIRRANRTLLRLEWPGAEPVSLDGTVIAADRALERRRVGWVLCAIRLPYAALRVSPVDDSPETRELETWCYLELAHRARRHTGRASLLDQYRAVNRLRERRSNSALPPGESLRAALSLEGLGVFDLADEFARDVVDGATADSATDAQRAQAKSWQVRVREKRAASSVEPGSPDDDESAEDSRIRDALQHGDSTSVAQSLDGLAPPLRDFYAAIAASPGKSAVDLYLELRPAVDADELPKSLRAEGQFYLGCLAIEAGDPAVAASDFAASAELEPNSPFAPLRNMYLGQLARR